MSRLTSQALGMIVPKNYSKFLSGAFLTLPHYNVIYTTPLINALSQICLDYNKAFDILTHKNKEHESDYQYCVGPAGHVSPIVRIDMAGLDKEFLKASLELSEDDLISKLRGKIFEFENSFGAYQIIQNVGGEESFLKSRFRAVLSAVRAKFGKPIALLAVTEEKFYSMRECEFGKENGESLSNEEILEISGFDAFMGPEDFRKHLKENSNNCEYLLFVRSSNPVHKLKNPAVEISHPLLQDGKIRKIIKANTLTINIDPPTGNFDVMINDTKEYLPIMKSAFSVYSEADIFSEEMLNHVGKGKPYLEFIGESLHEKFITFLNASEIDVESIRNGNLQLRAKPMKGVYGCYGHIRGSLSDGRFRKSLRAGIRQRGGYVLQPEIPVPTIHNSDTDTEYSFIDRNFFAFSGETVAFLGGIRNLLPTTSIEAREGRIHGNAEAVCAEIIALP